LLTIIQKQKVFTLEFSLNNSTFFRINILQIGETTFTNFITLGSRTLNA